jgi:hypothetical protein
MIQINEVCNNLQNINVSFEDQKKLAHSKYFIELGKTLKFVLQDDAKFWGAEHQSQEKLDDLQIFEMINSIIIEFKASKHRQCAEIQKRLLRLEDFREHVGDDIVCDIRGEVLTRNFDKTEQDNQNLDIVGQKGSEVEQHLEIMKVSELKQQCKVNIQMVKAAQQRASQAEKQLEIKNQNLTAVQQKVLVLEQQLEIKNSMMAAAHNKLSNLAQQKVLGLEQQRGTQKEMMTDSYQRYVVLEEQPKAKTKMFTAAQHEMSSLKQQLQTRTEIMIAAQQKAYEFEQQLEAQTEMLTFSYKTFFDIEKQLKTQTDILTATQQEIENFKQQLQDKTALKKAAQQKVCELEQQLEDKSTLTTAAQQKVSELEKQLEDKKTLTLAVQKKYYEVVKQLEAQTEMITVANRCLCELKLQLDEQTLKVTQFEEFRRSDGKSILVLNNAIALRDEQIEELKCQLEQLKQEEMEELNYQKERLQQVENVTVKVEPLVENERSCEKCIVILDDLKLQNLNLEFEIKLEKEKHVQTRDLLQTKEDTIQDLEAKLKEQQLLTNKNSTKAGSSLTAIRELRDKEAKSYFKNLTTLNNSLKERDDMIKILQWTSFIMDKKLQSYNNKDDGEIERKNRKIHKYKKHLSKLKLEVCSRCGKGRGGVSN